MKSLRFFAKMIRKTFFVLMATVVANASFVYCYDGRPRALPTKKYPSYLTSEQKDTLDTIRDVSGDNRLYKMDCTFDYKLDDLLSSMDRNVQNTNSLIKSIILPKSTKPPRRWIRPWWVWPAVLPRNAHSPTTMPTRAARKTVASTPWESTAPTSRKPSTPPWPTRRRQRQRQRLTTPFFFMFSLAVCKRVRQ